MTVVEVSAGACGFVTRIEAERQSSSRVNVTVSSDCEAVTALGEEIPVLGFEDVLVQGFGKGLVHEAASRTLTHVACPVAAGIIKAAEVELNLALPKTARIEFVSEK